MLSENYIICKRISLGKVRRLSDGMAAIEIRAMKEAGIPEDIALGWVIKAIENLQLQGVTKITNIPWNGLN